MQRIRAARKFGSATQEARQAGADMQQQFNYGMTRAAAEVLSEKLFDAAKLFGGGGADDVVERLVSKLAKTDAGRTVTRLLLSGVGEGAEEAVTDLVEPAIKGVFYDPVTMLATYGTPEGRRELAAQAAYDALISGVLGTAGGGIGVAKGVDAQKNAALREQEAAGRQAKTRTAYDRTKTENAIRQKYGALTDESVRALADMVERGASDYTLDATARNLQRQNGAQTDGAQLLKDYAQRNNAGSTTVNTDPAEHTAAEQRVIDAYQDTVDEQLVEFVANAAKNSGGNTARYNLKPVSDRAAADIKRITGVDTAGNQTVIEQRIAEHILKEHGENGSTDHSMRDLNDIGRIQYVLDHYDNVENGGTTKAYVTNKWNGRHNSAPTVLFSKAVNGTYYVVEAATDTSKKTNYIVSAYMSKNGAKKAGASHTADASAPAYTAKTENANTPVTTSISDSTGNSNRKFPQGSGATARGTVENNLYRPAQTDGAQLLAEYALRNAPVDGAQLLIDYARRNGTDARVAGLTETAHQARQPVASEAGQAQKNAASTGDAQYSFKGYDADSGRGIYESNFPLGTPKVAKGQRILSLIQNVWSKKPINLVIQESNGAERTIQAQFDPTYDPSGNTPSDTTKLMGGNRHGSAAEKRVTLDLADDYYQIASEAEYNYSKAETGKSSATHEGVNQWHYFVNDILFQELGKKEMTPYRVTINVKERNDGHFVYSFNAERQNNGPSTRRTLHADVNQSEVLGEANAQPVDSIRDSGEKSNPKPAKIRFDGGVVDGVAYAPVDMNRLTQRQWAAIQVVEKLSEVTGIQFVFYESQANAAGRYTGANGIYRNNTIYLDVNAGKTGTGIGEAAILRTASHELTHYIQQFSPEQYAEVKTFVEQHLLDAGQSLDALARQKLRYSSVELNDAQAMDEVVADACEMMLRDSTAIQTLARENRSLFDTIREWVADFAARIKKAFAGVEAVHTEAQAMIRYTDELQRLWDDALVRAVRSGAAARGETEYSSRAKAEESPLEAWARQHPPIDGAQLLAEYALRNAPVDGAQLLIDYARRNGTDARVAGLTETAHQARQPVASEAGQAQKNAASTGDAQYSIRYDAENTPFVVVEQDILQGVPQNEWVKTVKNNLREKFPNGVHVGNNLVVINNQSRREMTFSNYMQRIIKTEPNLYKDKLRAAYYADEILRASRNYVNEALLHPRKDAIIDFARGEVLLRIGTKDYKAQVIVGNRGNGNLLLYDIINLAPTEIQERTKKTGADRYTTKSPTETGSSQPAPAGDSIRNRGEKSNPNPAEIRFDGGVVDGAQLLIDYARRNGTAGMAPVQGVAGTGRSLPHAGSGAPVDGVQLLVDYMERNGGNAGISHLVEAAQAEADAAAGGNGLTNGAENGNLQSSDAELYGNPIRRGVGAKSITDYEVYNPLTGDKIEFVQGSRPIYPRDHLLAGKGSKKPIRQIDRLVEKYGGTPEEWKHEKAYFEAYDAYGEVCFVELHWFEDSTRNKYDVFPKVREGRVFFYDED